MLPLAVQAEGQNPYAKLVDTVTRGHVKTQNDYAHVMLDKQEHVTNKPLKQLLFRQDGTLQEGNLYLSGRAIGSTMYEKTDIAGKFPILSRLPPQHTSGEEGKETVLNDAAFLFTATPSPWVTLSLQGEYTDIAYPGQDDFQFRKYSLMVGNLAESPLYAAFGRNSVAFGNFTSYAPITHSHSAHYFWAQSDDPHLELGYYQDGLHLTASLIPAGRGTRVLNTPDSDGVDNVAFSIRKAFQVNDTVNAEVGAGYLRGTIYDSTLAHHPPSWNGGDNRLNPAYNIHATLESEKIDVNAEYTITEDQWPATDFRVSALTLQGRYKHELCEKPAIASVMYSLGKQGASNTNWQRMHQTVVGYELALSENWKLGGEYLYNKGFVPLILPTITGDRRVDSHTLLASVEFTF